MNSKNSIKDGILLISIDEKIYPKKSLELVKLLAESNGKICYLCISKPFLDIIADIKKHGIDINKFHFIDVLTSHYLKQKPVSNCTFVDSPSNIEMIKQSIKAAIIREKCGKLIIDSISSLISYIPNFDIIKLTHDLKSGEIGSMNAIKKSVLFALQEEILKEDHTPLLKDLSMFADEVIFFNNSQNSRFDGI